MKRNFELRHRQDRLFIRQKSSVPFHSHFFYLDHPFNGIYSHNPRMRLDKRTLHPGRHVLVIYSSTPHHQPPFFTSVEKFVFYITHQTRHHRRRAFQAGDILVACDNVGGLPPGYMGHSAIVIDNEHIIESPGPDPAIRKTPIQTFLEEHPLHTHFHPRLRELGKKAAKYAENYYDQYEEKGSQNPEFSLFPFQDLDDPWGSIYCSKLVWLCYYYGADYKFDPGYFWFSPEDLYHTLKNDRHFDLVYEHPEFHFHINI